MDYRSTLNLPNTSFPMRANLAKREPEFMKIWEDLDIYHRQRQRRQDKPEFVLHDGPPYANGEVHLGTGMNKILKDMVNKSKLLLGYNVHYRPGWDCHGLPIENNVMKSLSEAEKQELDTVAIRKRCRNFALKFVDKHRKSFRRLGVMGEWERPYLTLAPAFEGEELRQFAHLVRKGFVYQGLKPVYWCPDCQTALAEAEVEYDDHVSPSIFVRFPLDESSNEKLTAKVADAAGQGIDVIIWTTTPWTLPANRAVCLHPNFLYSLLPVNGRLYLIAQDLVESFIQQAGVQLEGEPLGPLTGEEIQQLGIALHHPIADITVPIICGTHVTLEQGTGAVHTAPGHGHEDYLIGMEYKLEVFSPVDSKGCFTAEAGVCEGERVHQANKHIIERLKERALLVHNEDYHHSYPHCWRSKSPIIFRATRQWFVSLETDNFRNQLVNAIEEVNWIPSWGKSRIRGMVENRQEWCISRQRAWGVPIPAFYIKGSEEAVLDAQFIDEVASLVQEEGTIFWYKALQDPNERKRIKRLNDLLPEGKTIEDVQLETDILDVWFDSGVSHQSVMRQEEGIFPVDLYLEGTDQHRGWFQSSLVISVGAGHGKPYKAVLTHGFTVDEDGKKLSKSAGNFVGLDDLLKENGADIFRLWIASEDIRNDLRISNNIIKRVAESYRRLRNTVRFLLGNLHGFSPDSLVPEQERYAFDRWALYRWRESKRNILNAYERYDFHRVVYEMNNLASIDLSSIYLDVIKDRLYCSALDSHARLSAQSTLYEITVDWVGCMATILSFTAEEAWQELRSMNLTRLESVFDYEADQEIPVPDEAFVSQWDRILKLRAEAISVIEHARKQDRIGHPLDAQVVLQTDDPEWQSLIDSFINAQRGDDLRSLLIVSHVERGSVEGMPVVEPSEEIPGLTVGVDKAPGEKCPRCWNYATEVGQEGQEVCHRCEEVLQQLTA